MSDQKGQLRADDNIQDILTKQFAQVSDFVLKSMRLKCNGQLVQYAYLSATIDDDKLLQHIVQPLALEAEEMEQVRSLLQALEGSQSQSWEQIFKGLWQGKVCLHIEGESSAYLLDAASWPTPEIIEPENESTLKGTRSGFTESNSSNIALIRHHLPEESFAQEQLRTGDDGKIVVTMLYLPDRASQENIDILKERLMKVAAPTSITMGELAEQLEDNNYSLFPQLLLTERPDVAAIGVGEGKIALLMGNSPHVLLAPMAFLSFFMSVDDRSMRWPVITFFRLLRFVGLLIAIFLPSVYISAVSYHYEIIPIDLVLSLANSLERVPVPPILEAFFMELILEMLREASLRLPPKVGQSIGIVGGIVIGQAAVEAGLVSNVMVIVVAMTAIASFIQPNQDMAAAVRMLRFPFMIAAYLMGLVGIVIGVMLLMCHIASMQSLKMPYGSPLLPIRADKWKSVLARFPMRGFKRRMKG